MRLRSSLILLVFSTLVPMVALVVVLSALQVRHQEESLTRAVQDRNRAFMSAVDAELKGAIGTLLALAASRNLAAGDLRAFQQEARAVHSTQPGWLNVTLATTDGRQVLDAASPSGAPPLAAPIQPESLRAVLQSARPAVGGVSQGLRQDKHGVPVRVPVMSGTKALYVLTAVLDVDQFAQLMKQQRVPEGGLTGLLDAQGRYIARIPHRPVGSSASERLRSQIAGAREGWYRGVTHEGNDMFAAHLTSDLTNWSVGFALPADTVLGVTQRAVWVMAAGLLLSLGIGVGVALWLGVRITRPMSRLASAAQSLGRDRPEIRVPTRITEVGQLAQALNRASRDIEERDILLRHSEERFRLAQDTALQGFTLFSPVRDGEGRLVDLSIEYMNAAGAAYSNRSPADVIGRTLDEAFPRMHENGVVAMLLKVVETGVSLDTEIHFVSTRVDSWFRLMAVKVGDGLATSYIDVTGTKRLEEELIGRADALKRADRNKSEFLAMLSHELRNPLAPLANGLALLKKSGEGGPDAQVREMMERQIRQLARLIDDLLDISRIDRGKLELHRERVAADAVLRSAVEIARPNIEARGHELVLRFSGTHMTLDADPVRMAQVVSNVLNNAAKFTAPGGRIEVSLQAEGDGEVAITVTDDGIGVKPEEAEKIFEMFVQLDSSRSQSAGGLGLGLTLARSIVERHGGRIWAESAGPGRGTRFTIRLPAAPGPIAQPHLRSVDSIRVSGKRVLVVDDNVDAAETLSQLLSLVGHDVRTAYEGGEAWSTAEAFRPECILLDLNLPGIDGLELGRRLRAAPWGRDVRLIALTGMGQASDITRTGAAGFDHHVTKPARPEEILKLVA
jgi:signal transduction histidine kinase